MIASRAEDVGSLAKDTASSMGGVDAYLNSEICDTIHSMTNWKWFKKKILINTFQLLNKNDLIGMI